MNGFFFFFFRKHTRRAGIQSKPKRTVGKTVAWSGAVLPCAPVLLQGSSSTEVKLLWARRRACPTSTSQTRNICPASLACSNPGSHRPWTQPARQAPERLHFHMTRKRVGFGLLLYSELSVCAWCCVFLLQAKVSVTNLAFPDCPRG